MHVACDLRLLSMANSTVKDECGALPQLEICGAFRCDNTCVATFRRRRTCGATLPRERGQRHRLCFSVRLKLLNMLDMMHSDEGGGARDDAEREDGGGDGAAAAEQECGDCAVRAGAAAAGRG